MPIFNININDTWETIGPTISDAMQEKKKFKVIPSARDRDRLRLETAAEDMILRYAHWGARVTATNNFVTSQPIS